LFYAHRNRSIILYQLFYITGAYGHIILKPHKAVKGPQSTKWIVVLIIIEQAEELEKIEKTTQGTE
jgi:hypothetical protein